MRVSPAISLAVLLAACTSGTEENTVPVTTTNASVQQRSPDALRDEKQRPQEVITLMGGDLNGLTIADLFAGDGYFTFKMIEAGANVIAIDSDPANIAKIEARKKALQLSDDRLRIRAVPVGDPGLQPEEVDMALIVHNFLRIADRKAYFDLMRRGVRFPRPVFMVEWLYEESPDGPPISERMPIEQMMDEVGLLGFADVGAHSKKIPGQVIMIASDYAEYDEHGKPILPTQ
ncbi:MAG: class I SAM-dependent methyltransferase [Flavobacteriales bacterium]